MVTSVISSYHSPYAGAPNTSPSCSLSTDSRAAMAVFDLDPRDGHLDEPLRSQEMIMLKEVLYVEEPERAVSPVAGVQTHPAPQHALLSLPSSFGSFEFSFSGYQEDPTSAEGQERTAPVVELPAAKRQATAPAVLNTNETEFSVESALQSPFASAENIDRFLEELPSQSVSPQQLRLLQQTRQHSAPAPTTLSRALLESHSQELSLQHICTADQAKARVASLPTSKMLSWINMQVSLSPVVWRDFEAPHRVMVNSGLRCMEMEGNSCYPASIYAAFNPRVITTGDAQCQTCLTVALCWSRVCCPAYWSMLHAPIRPAGCMHAIWCVISPQR